MATEKPGDGSILPPVQWWHPIHRSVMGTEHDGARWDVDVDFSDWDEKVRLYRDRVQDRVQRGNSRFELDGGARIEVTLSMYGLQRAHLVLPDGTERQLDPAPRTGEWWRAELDRRYPTFSRRLGAVSWIVLVVALVLQVPQLIELGAEITGWYAFSSPVNLPVWLNAPLTIAGILAAFERALRLRHHWLLD